MHKITTLFFILFCYLSFSQDAVKEGGITLDDLKEGANSVVKKSIMKVTVLNQKSLNIKSSKTVLVLNNEGLRNLDTEVGYDKSLKIKALEAKHYDAAGKLIKVYRGSDFKDQSVADGFSVFSDDRKRFLNFTPIQFPFILEFSYETETDNTAFLPTWFPMENYLGAVQKSEYSITYPQDLGFRYKEFNLQGFNIKKETLPNTIRFTMENQMAIKAEAYNPSGRKIFPFVTFATDKFYLEGVEGTAANWAEFGSWMNANLLKGMDELPAETITAIRKLAETEKDPIKKARIVYDFVQKKTRYVSIQLGIGGWKPMPAKDVDRLGYGDCKALSNYTKALLAAVGVPSYYTIVYADDTKRDIIEDFVSMQGNHAILAIPQGEKLLFLECTSQISPFSYQGDSTDDRNVLIVTPEGGKIVRTGNFTDRENLQQIKGNYAIDENGNLTGSYAAVSNGIQYENKYLLERKSKPEIEEFYKNTLLHIKNLSLTSSRFKNDREKIEFTENIELTAEGYAQKINGDLIFSTNAFNVNRHIPQRYRSRKNSFEVERGFTDNDEVTVDIPAKYKLEGVPEPLELKCKFGSYSFEYNYVAGSNTLSYKRQWVLNRGSYPKEEYDEFRKFMEDVAKYDNNKILLKSR